MAYWHRYRSTWLIDTIWWHRYRSTWLREWFVAWQHQATMITLNNIAFALKIFCGIHLRGVSQEVHMKWIINVVREVPLWPTAPVVYPVSPAGRGCPCRGSHRQIGTLSSLGVYWAAAGALMHLWYLHWGEGHCQIDQDGNIYLYTVYITYIW